MQARPASKLGIDSRYLAGNVRYAASPHRSVLADYPFPPGWQFINKKRRGKLYAHLVPSIVIHTLIRSAMQGQNDAIGEFFFDFRQDATFNRDENTFNQRHIFAND